jgi:hypothetical protein
VGERVENDLIDRVWVKWWGFIDVALAIIDVVLVRVPKRIQSWFVYDEVVESYD